MKTAYTHKDAPKNKIETSVTILHIFDTDSTPDDYLFQDEDYRAEDQKRLDAWKRDEWYFIGIRVCVRIHNWQTGNSREYESGGLWSIESDSDDSYLLQVAQDQLNELQAEFPELEAVTLDKAVTQSVSQ